METPSWICCALSRKTSISRSHRSNFRAYQTCKKYRLALSFHIEITYQPKSGPFSHSFVSTVYDQRVPILRQPIYVYYYRYYRYLSTIIHFLHLSQTGTKMRENGTRCGSHVISTYRSIHPLPQSKKETKRWFDDYWQFVYHRKEISIDRSIVHPPPSIIYPFIHSYVHIGRCLRTYPILPHNFIIPPSSRVKCPGDVGNNLRSLNQLQEHSTY